MNPHILKWLKPALPAILVALALCLASEQLRVQHILAELYLFWGYIMVAVMAALLAMIIAGYRRLTLGLVLIVLCVASLSSWQWDAQRNESSPAGPALKVITYNWLADPHDRGPAYDWIKAQDPDILLLAEFGAWMPGVKDRLYAQFPYRSQPAGDVILLSKYPISHQKITHFGNRAALLAQLDVKGRLLTVYGIHPWTLRTLDELAMRDAYLADLADSLSPKAPPLIMLGDFNATRWEPALREVIRRGDLHEEPRLVPLATRMGVRSKLPFIGSPIDHIFTNGRNHLSGCHTGPALGSDHLPLVCEFRFAG